MVFAKYRAVVFVHGCFWHAHMCKLFKFPATRPEFWKDKIAANVVRDGKTQEKLIGLGWRIAIVWECAIKGKSIADAKIVLLPLAHWLRNSLDAEILEI
jgi:DNA mismatch endonuclease (patch repair protein)